MRGPKPGSSTFDPTQTVTSAINAYLTATGTPNAAVVLIFQGQNYFFQFTNPNITPAPPAVTATTLFEIGSITKVFTATMLAYNLSSMSLSDPVTKYLPYTFAQNAGLRFITLQELATHTSGMPSEIPGHPSIELFNGESPSSALISWWQSFNTPPVTPPAPPPPGSCWLYSNIAFVTLGFVVGGCTTNTYNQQLSQNILTPLKMTQTGASDPPGVTVLQGYTGPPTKNTPAKSQAADLKSTPQDMTTFLAACINPSQSSIPSALGTALAFAQKPVYSGNICGGSTPIAFKQGLAWQISQLTVNGTDYSLVAKDGATGIGGFEAWIGFIPSAAMGIVVMGNKFMTVPSTPKQSPTKAGRTILQTLLGAITN